MDPKHWLGQLAAVKAKEKKKKSESSIFVSKCVPQSPLGKILLLLLINKQINNFKKYSPNRPDFFWCITIMTTFKNFSNLMKEGRKKKRTAVELMINTKHKLIWMSEMEDQLDDGKLWRQCTCPNKMFVKRFTIKQK